MRPRSVTFEQKPAALQFPRLSEDELRLCRKLLATPLHKPAEFRRLLKAIERTPLRSPVSLAQWPADTRVDYRKVRWIDWRTTAEESLWRVQARWRGAVLGPRLVDPSSYDYETKDLVGHSFALRNFDVCAFSPHEELRLPPFILQLCPIVGTVNRLQPRVRVTIRKLEDLFDWLLVRAIANFQLSRLALCVRCGHWVLKEIAGQRSQKLFDLLKKARKNNLPPPDICFRFPMWPALCGKPRCKNVFFKTLSEQIAFRYENFHFDEGMRQYGPKARKFLRPKGAPLRRKSCS